MLIGGGGGQNLPAGQFCWAKICMLGYLQKSTFLLAQIDNDRSLSPEGKKDQFGGIGQ